MRGLWTRGMVVSPGMPSCHLVTDQAHSLAAPDRVTAFRLNLSDVNFPMFLFL
jgi:hypothetical protein